MRLILPLLLLTATAFGIEATPTLTPAERRGRELYLRGTPAASDSAPQPDRESIQATFDDWATTAPAAALACANCHGNDGRGRAEGGATPSNITVTSLRRPYQVTTPGGRTHGSYDDRSMKKAVMLGLDPAGNRLDRVMPRYAMSQSDWEDLLAWLKRLGTLADPGLSETTLRLGVILPPHDSMPEVASIVRTVARGWFGEVNTRGGLYGRNVELAFCAQRGSPAERAAALERCIDEQDLFALVASFTDGAERELATVAEEKEVPLVTSVATNPRSSIAPGRYVRELLAGVIEQSAALVGLAGRETTARGSAAVVSRDPRLNDARDAAVLHLRGEGFMSVETIDAAKLDLQSLRRRNVEALLILDAQTAAETLDWLRGENLRGERPWKPLLLIPAAFAGAALVIENVPATAFISVPMLQNDQTAAALETHRRLVPETKHRAVEMATLASASLATDALARAGRDLTRDAFLDALDATWRYQTGFAPQFTFRRDRHIGSTGCHIVMLRPGEAARSLWVDAGK